MTETVFEQHFLCACRIASVRAAKTVGEYRLAGADVQDLQQEAFLALLRSAHKLDARRGNWRTFTEVVIGNCMTSCIRHMYAERRGHFRNQPLEAQARCVPAPNRHLDLRADVQRVLDGVSAFDREVAWSLMDRSPSETGRDLRLSRATVYRAVGRLRLAFTRAGFSVGRCRAARD